MKKQLCHIGWAVMLYAVISLSSLDAQTRAFPYEFKLGFDLTLIPCGVAFKGISDVMEEKLPVFSIDEIERLDRNDVNRIDRFATHLWSPRADNARDVVNYILLGAPAVLVFPELMKIREKKRWQNLALLGLMYTETYFLTKGITNCVQAIVKRNRPYLYNSSLGLEERHELAQDLGAYQSFFSGHTSGAFAAAVFLSKSVTDIYGRSALSTIAWTTSLSLAATTAILSVAAGRHYLTDVLAAAAVGGGVGFLVPVLHKKRTPGTNPSVDLGFTTLSIGFTY